MAWQENEERGEEEEGEGEEVVVDGAKWGGEWRICVMGGNEKGFYFVI